MRKFRLILGEGTVGYSPIGVLPVDEFTKDAPIGKVEAVLDRFENRRWWPTSRDPIVTGRGVIAYPGLERRADPAGKPRVFYRVRLSAEFYVPRYPPLPNGAFLEGVVFQVEPYGLRPPLPPPALRQVDLFPGPNYPFPSHVPVVRGRVIRRNNTPVPSAEVSHALTDLTLTNATGQFALPVRWVKFDAQNPVWITLDAEAKAERLRGSIRLQLPEGLDKSQTITVT